MGVHFHVPGNKAWEHLDNVSLLERIRDGIEQYNLLKTTHQQHMSTKAPLLQDDGGRRVYMKQLTICYITRK